MGEGPVHALDLAVLPGAERPRVLVLDPAGGEHRVEVDEAVRRAVARHDPLDPDPDSLVERQRSSHEGAGGSLPLVGQELGVGYPAVVVDGYV